MDDVFLDQSEIIQTVGDEELTEEEQRSRLEPRAVLRQAAINHLADLRSPRAPGRHD